ncbi:MAG: response regulator, partial [Gammaproteobacteria bacterium]|nr:response regulator [Gammaproteobacteria bacterium]
MDCQMPVLDGYEAAAEIRAFSKLPIIAVTANVMPEDIRRAHQAGMNDHIAKPIDVEALYGVLLKWTSGAEFDDVEEPESVETAWPQLASIDIARGVATCGGDVELFRRLAGKFRHGHANDAAQLRATATDTDCARRLLHTLKGTAANLAAFPLAGQAGELQQTLDDGAPLREHHIERLEKQLRAVMDDIDRLGETTAADSGPDPGETLSGEALASAMARLREEIRNYDAASEDTLSRILSTTSDRNVVRQLEALRKPLAQYDFDRAIDLIEDIEIVTS